MEIESGFDHFIAQVDELPAIVHDAVFFTKPTDDQIEKFKTTFVAEELSLFLIFVTPKEKDIHYLEALDVQNEVKFKITDYSTNLLVPKTKKLREITRYAPFLICEQERVVKAQKVTTPMQKSELTNAIELTARELRIFCLINGQSNEDADAAQKKMLQLSKKPTVSELKQVFEKEVLHLQWSYGAQFYIINREAIDKLKD